MDENKVERVKTLIRTNPAIEPDRVGLDNEPLGWASDLANPARQSHSSLAPSPNIQSLVMEHVLISDQKTTPDIFECLLGLGQCTA